MSGTDHHSIFYCCCCSKIQRFVVILFCLRFVVKVPQKNGFQCVHMYTIINSKN